MALYSRFLSRNICPARRDDTRTALALLHQTCKGVDAEDCSRWKQVFEERVGGRGGGRAERVVRVTAEALFGE